MNNQVYRYPQSYLPPVPQNVEIVDRVSEVDWDDGIEEETQIGSRSHALSRLGIPSKNNQTWSRTQKGNVFVSFLLGCVVVLHKHSLGMFVGASRNKFILYSTLFLTTSLLLSAYVTQHFSQSWVFFMFMSVLIFLSIGIVSSLLETVWNGILFSVRYLIKVGQENL